MVHNLDLRSAAVAHEVPKAVLEQVIRDRLAGLRRSLAVLFLETIEAYLGYLSSP